MSGEAFGDIRLFGFQFDEAIQLMSEYQVEMELEGCPLSPEMSARFDELKRQFCHFAGLLHAVNYTIIWFSFAFIRLLLSLDTPDFSASRRSSLPVHHRNFSCGNSILLWR